MLIKLFLDGLFFPQSPEIRIAVNPFNIINTASINSTVRIIPFMVHYVFTKVNLLAVNCVYSVNNSVLTRSDCNYIKQGNCIYTTDTAVSIINPSLWTAGKTFQKMTFCDVNLICPRFNATSIRFSYWKGWCVFGIWSAHWRKLYWCIRKKILNWPVNRVSGGMTHFCYSIGVLALILRQFDQFGGYFDRVLVRVTSEWVRVPWDPRPSSFLPWGF